MSAVVFPNGFFYRLVMSHSMKYIALILLVYSGAISACIVGPQRIGADTSYGFTFESKISDLCEQCRMVSVTAPEKYKDREFGHGLVTLHHEGEIISRFIHSSFNESGAPEFVGILSSKKGFTYEITFEYGKGRCKAYQFTYKAQ